jgi:hypothetical protein
MLFDLEHASIWLELLILVNGFPSISNVSLFDIPLLECRGIISRNDENLQSLPEDVALEFILEDEDLLFL